ncbi:Alpha/beta hydrolase fold-1 [Lyophyllum atratum]|nr:Alpha/beta hydrolase fold-1 [Lyophyllum atratum]
MLEEAIRDGPRDGYPLITTAKRYWLPELEAMASDPNALTLVLLHSTSFHKETWEPSLERLLKHSAQQGSHVKIREAWALDCPNHGEAGHVNEGLLHEPEYRNSFTCEKYAKAAHRFLSDGPNHEARVDFRRRNLVGIGHSLGGNAMLILQHLEPRVPFEALIIVEPLISPAGPSHLQRLREMLIKGAHERRDVWRDREQARPALKKKNWDPRVTDLYLKHAIVPHPRSYEKETPYPGFTLACTRDQEAAMYRDADGPTRPVHDLKKACTVLPVHLILGGVNDLMPARVHAAILDPQYGGKYASFRKLDGVGHLVPQEAPDELGDMMYEALASGCVDTARPKL